MVLWFSEGCASACGGSESHEILRVSLLIKTGTKKRAPSPEDVSKLDQLALEHLSLERRC